MKLDGPASSAGGVTGFAFRVAVREANGGGFLGLHPSRRTFPFGTGQVDRHVLRRWNISHWDSQQATARWRGKFGVLGEWILQIDGRVCLSKEANLNRFTGIWIASYQADKPSFSRSLK